LEAGANVNAVDATGSTPLMMSLDGARPEVVKLLLDKGADPTTRRADGDNALLIALSKNQLANYVMLDAATAAKTKPLPGDSAGIPFKYLSELKPTATKTAAAPPNPPLVKKLPSPHGVWLAPPEDKKPGHATYALDKKFRFLQGFIALSDAANLKKDEALQFRVVGDGKELYKSGPILVAGDHRGVKIEVAGVDKLELFVDCAGDRRAPQSLAR
jgi:ankyrin repeat protein